MKTIALALFVAACGAAHSSTPPPSSQPIPVGIATVTRRDVPLHLEAIASLDGYTNVELRARVRGYLTGQSYKDGGRVKAGDVLFRIEPAEFSTNGEAAEANVARARVQLDKAKLEAERDRGLRTAGMISQQDLDNADAAVARRRGTAPRERRPGRAGVARSSIHDGAVADRRRGRARPDPRRQPRRSRRPDAAGHGLAARPDAGELPAPRGRVREAPRVVRGSRPPRSRMGLASVRERKRRRRARPGGRQHVREARGDRGDRSQDRFTQRHGAAPGARAEPRGAPASGRVRARASPARR